MSKSSPDPDEGRQRLQKVLAAAGVGSRRTCEELIRAGRVEVDGEVVDELGTRIDPETAVVKVDGERVSVHPDRVYLALNKPRGVLSAMSDDRGRLTLSDLVPDAGPRLFHVGRLDADTEGLLLLTNDGELAQRLAHPSYEVEKTYLAEVDGEVSRETVRQLLAGVNLDDGLARADRCRIVSRVPGRTLVELVLHSGRNRVVRRMLDAVGHPVRRLVRTTVGPVRLGDLPVGESRPLSRAELTALYEDVAPGPAASRNASGRGTPSRGASRRAVKPTRKSGPRRRR